MGTFLVSLVFGRAETVRARRVFGIGLGCRYRPPVDGSVFILGIGILFLVLGILGLSQSVVSIYLPERRSVMAAKRGNTCCACATGFETGSNNRTALTYP